MIVAFLRTKLGMLTMTLLVFGVFFTLSRARLARAHTAQTPSPARVEAGSTNAHDPVTLVKKGEAFAQDQADALRRERSTERRSTASVDEAGNLVKRRATPQRVDARVIAPVASDERVSPVGPELIPSLRIRGRTRTDSVGTPLAKATDVLIPSWADRNAANPARRSPAALEKRIPPTRFVPYGRLIKAELVMTLESTRDEMPLISLVVEPVYNNGRLIIPAGTELHSTARPDRVRDRIVSGTTWRMVFPREGVRPNGRQLTFDGVALDRDDRDGNGLTWGLTDGSFGLRGRVIRGAETRETMLLFLAEALKAASSASMDRQLTLVGSQVEANAKNAALAGSQAVLSKVAEGISRELERNGVYLQVPAGKQFYVYPRQVIDADRADIPQSVAPVE